MMDLAEAMRQASVGHTIKVWCKINRIGQLAIAARLGVSAAFISQVVNDDKMLPDDRIPMLPDGLRQQIAEIRARRYEGLASMVRRSVGIKKEKAS